MTVTGQDCEDNRDTTGLFLKAFYFILEGQTSVLQGAQQL